jgi:hypothetical protein
VRLAAARARDQARLGGAWRRRLAQQRWRLNRHIRHNPSDAHLVREERPEAIAEQK